MAGQDKIEMNEENSSQEISKKTEKAELKETPQERKQIPELTEVDMLSSKVVELEKNTNYLKDQLLRKAAEFENYKKRVGNDYATLIKYSNEELIIKLLPVLDDFERSMKAKDHNHPPTNKDEKATGKTNDNAFIKGIELIYNKLKKILENEGVKRLDVVGKAFDPEYHDALMQVARTDVPPLTVVEEIEKGYLLDDKVIRHAKVIVSAEQEVKAMRDSSEPTNEAKESDHEGAN